MDLDFGSLLAASGGRLPSVITFRLADERSEVVNARLVGVLERCSDDLAEGAIVSVKESAIRMRRLPLR